MNQDQNNLQLLAVFHYIVGGMMGLLAFFPVIHLLLGIGLIIFPEKMAEGGDVDFPIEYIGGLFVAIGAVMFVLGMLFAICVVYSGRMIAQRKKYMFSFVMGCMLCVFFPFGTILGVFTIVVLSKDSVKAIYGR